MSDDIFDFGFTAVDEDELQAVKAVEEKVAAASSTAQETQRNIRQTVQCYCTVAK